MANEAFLTGGARGLDVGDGKGNALMVVTGFVDGTGALVRTSSSNAIPVTATLTSTTLTATVLPPGGLTLTSGQVTVASAIGASSWVGTAIVGSSTTGQRVTVTNFNATGWLFVNGTSAVASSSGHAIAAGSFQTFNTRSGIWGIASSGQINVSYLTEAP